MTNAVFFALIVVFLVARVALRVARKAWRRAEELRRAAHQKGVEVQKRWEESERRKELDRMRDEILRPTPVEASVEAPVEAPVEEPVDLDAPPIWLEEPPARPALADDFPVPPPPPPPAVDLTLPPVAPLPEVAPLPPLRKPSMRRGHEPPAPPPPPVAVPLPDVEPDLTLAQLERRLFSDAAPGYEVIERFRGEFRGRRVRWTGELDRADRLLGRPGVQVTLEAAHSRAPFTADPTARPLRYAFRLELAEGEDLLGAPARAVTVEGTLDDCDPYLRQLALSDARRVDG